MTDDIDQLFQELKEISANNTTNNKKNIEKNDEISSDNDHNSDKLIFEDDVKTKNTEQIFQTIEKDLRSLPKLNNTFDQLASNAKKTSTKPADSNKDGRNSDKKSEDWFNIPKPSDSMRQRLEKDLILIKHRAALDPKRHYKKDRWTVPDRFAVGTIIEDKTEFYSSRLTNKQRKSNILDTLMNDDQTNKYFKRKFTEIQIQKSSGKRSHYKKNKQLRRKF